MDSSASYWFMGGWAQIQVELIPIGIVWDYTSMPISCLVIVLTEKKNADSEEESRVSNGKVKKSWEIMKSDNSEYYVQPCNVIGGLK